MAGGWLHFWRLAADARRLAAHGALRPFEHHADLSPAARLGARLLRLGTGAPATPDYAGGLAACGPAAIKLGQALATRPDLVGHAAAADLGRLQDRLPPVPFGAIERVLDSALPGGWRAQFAQLDPVPLGSASIAQVHRAVDHAGRPVALKVLRPGVEARFARAIARYRWAAARLERLGGEFVRLRPADVIDSFAAWTEVELDLRREAGHASELADAVRGEPAVMVPPVHWRWTGRSVLALDWMDGVPLGDRAQLLAAGHDPATLARHLVRAFLAQAIGRGFFHADLHQGNVIVRPDGRLALIDCGIMGRLDRRARVDLAQILHGLLVGDYDRVARIHFDAGFVPARHDARAFASALRAVGEPIRGRAASEISVAQLLDGLFAITRQFDMPTQPHLLLLQKTMVMVEGLAISLDPEINLWDVAAPYVSRWMRDELGPEALLADALRDGALMLRQAPEAWRRWMAGLPPDPSAPPPTPEPGARSLLPDRAAPAAGGSSWPAFAAGAGAGVLLVVVLLMAGQA